MIAKADTPRRSRKGRSLGWGSVPLTAEQWQLVLDNKGLIVPMLKKCGVIAGLSELEFGEWFQDVGMAAVARAARAFDPARGFKFSTYACRAIIQSIGREKRERFKRQSRCLRFADLTPAPGDDEPYTDRDGPAPDMLAGLEAEDLRERINWLGPLRRRVILGRFFEGKKLREMAGEMGIVPERVRQLEETSLEMLRGWLNGSKRKRRCTA